MTWCGKEKLSGFYPLDRLADGGMLDGFKVLFCLDNVRLMDNEVDNYLNLNGISDPRLKTQLLEDVLAARFVGGVWDFTSKEEIRHQLLREFDGRFALINGREDVGNSLRRVKAVLNKMGIGYDEYQLDSFSIEGDTLLGFPGDIEYKFALLFNPEPLESDSAPIYLLKSALLEKLECMVMVIPSSQADFLARSKLSTSMALSRAGIPTPRTLITSSIHEALRFVHSLHASGIDVVVKPVAKGGGWAVNKIVRGQPDNVILDILGKYKWWYGAGVLLLQEFINNYGHDKRVLIIDGVILGAEKRSAAIGGESWIYNISKGGVGSPATLSSKERDLVLSAFKLLKQFFSGIDLISDLDGNHYILEVNSCPGFKGFEKYLNIDVATFLINYLVFFT
ncbi:MAG: ATP-grasp domain-containing protein [Promethearchaeota archaeon]